jgi:HAE1 family hydrophobic/amphiphilic exporter-1
VSTSPNTTTSPATASATTSASRPGKAEFTQPSDLAKIFLRNKSGKLVRLDSVASFGETLGPAVHGPLRPAIRRHFLRHPDPAAGRSGGQGQAQRRRLLPTGYQVKLIGQAEEFGKTQKYMTFAFALAMTLLYMVLASQFNSFVQPFIVMLAQPLAIVGGVARCGPPATP